MIISKDLDKKIWKVTNKKMAFNQTWPDGTVSKNKECHCTCDQYRKYSKLGGECTHIKQVKETLKHF